MVDYVVTGLSANSVPYSTALEHQRAVHADVVEWPGARYRPPPRAPVRVHGGQAHRAVRTPDRRHARHRRGSRRQDHLARSRPARRVSDRATRRSRRRRRVRAPARGHAHRGARRVRDPGAARRGTQRRVAGRRRSASRREDRGHRHPGRRRRHHARLRAQLLQLVRRLRHDRRVRARRRRRHQHQPRARPQGHPGRRRSADRAALPAVPRAEPRDAPEVFA